MLKIYANYIKTCTKLMQILIKKSLKMQILKIVKISITVLVSKRFIQLFFQKFTELNWQIKNKFAKILPLKNLCKFHNSVYNKLKHQQWALENLWATCFQKFAYNVKWWNNGLRCCTRMIKSHHWGDFFKLVNS